MIVEKLLARIGRPDLLDILTKELSSAELNSLLLEVFNQKVQQLSPAELVAHYQKNRFVKPADIDVVSLRQLEDIIYNVFQLVGFLPVELSPVAPLGSCAVVATADQNKIISATRHTEVLADATNALALHIADQKRRSGNQSPATFFRYCTIQRHIRAQALPDIAGFRAHFKIGCLVTAGRDTGSFQFEKQAVNEHIAAMTALLQERLHVDKLWFRLCPRKGYPDPKAFVHQLAEAIQQQQPTVVFEVETGGVGDNNYYKGLQYKVVMEHNGHQLEIGDGGFVDWTQQLLQNKKERMFTTGIGAELLWRLLEGKL